MNKITFCPHIFLVDISVMVCKNHIVQVILYVLI